MKRITQRMVAEAAGVSVAAVSLALRGDVQLPEATRRRICGAAEEMGYRPNPVLAAGMAQVRHRKEATVGAVLLCLHSQPREEIDRWAGTRAIVDGVRERAAALGYRLEAVHLRVEERRRLLKRIRDLGIPGGVVIGPRWPELDAVLEELAERVPLVRASGSRLGVRLNFTQVDFFRGVRLALDEVKAAGARRPGLAVPSAFDQAAGRSLSGGFWAGQMDWPKKDRVEPLLDWDEANFAGRLQTWWRRWRPDVILTNQKQFSLSDWEALNPTDTPARMVQIGLTAETPGWAGVRFREDQMGMAAVDMVVAQIHRGERGLPVFQKGTMIEGEWVC